MLRTERLSTAPLTLEDSPYGTPSAVSQITARVLAELSHLDFLAEWTQEDKRPLSHLEVAPSHQLVPCVPYQVNEGQLSSRTASRSCRKSTCAQFFWLPDTLVLNAASYSVTAATKGSITSAARDLHIEGVP